MSHYGFGAHKLMQGASPRTFRHLVKLFPAIRGTGAKLRRISPDWQEWDIELPLSLRTLNYVGTHFGGTLYSAADPWPMLAWMKILGPDAVVWDKAATVRFRRPGRGKLRMELRITDDEIADVRAALRDGKFDRTHRLAWCAKDGTVIAEVDKVVHFRPASPKGLTGARPTFEA